MSMMCKMNEKCCKAKGPCIHEWMMMGVMMMAVMGAIGHWVLNWF